MIFFDYWLFMYYYLKGVIQFRYKNYVAAELFLKKTMKYKKQKGNQILYQYYGQTLLCLGKTEESFAYLSKAYDLCDKKGWEVANEEEYLLTKGTLDALKYLDEHCNLKVDNFVYDKHISNKRGNPL